MTLHHSVKHFLPFPSHINPFLSIQAEEEKIALQNAMDANNANQDQMNEILQREQNLLDRVGALESQIDDIQEENRVKYAEKMKETDRLLVALKEAEQKAREAELQLGELIKAQESASSSSSSANNAADGSSASAGAMLEQQKQMDAIKSRMSHLEKTNADLNAKCEELQREKVAVSEEGQRKENKFKETMAKGKR